MRGPPMLINSARRSLAYRRPRHSRLNERPLFTPKWMSVLEMKNVTISVVIPVRNGSHLIRTAIQSIFGQGQEDVECVVADDGSTDGLQSAIASFARQPVRLVASSEPYGPGAARNRGAGVARGEWLLFLDVDDELTHDWYSSVAPFLSENCGLILGGAEFVGENGQHWVVSPGRVDLRGGLRDVGLLAGSYLVRRDVFQAAGSFDSRLMFAENQDLALRIGPACADLSLGTAVAPDPIVIIHNDRNTKAFGHYSEARERAITILLMKYAEQLREANDIEAQWWRIVAMCRLHQVKRAESRRALLRAVRSQPRSRSNLMSAGRLFARSLAPRRIMLKGRGTTSSDR